MKVYFDDLFQEFISIETLVKGYSVTFRLLEHVPYDHPFVIGCFNVFLDDVEDLNLDEQLTYKIIQTEDFKKLNIIVLGVPNRLKENNQ